MLDFGFHFIVDNQPHILEGMPEAIEMGVTSFKIFMTYKKRPKRMCTDEFIASVMEKLTALGGVCQLHCENGDIISWLEDRRSPPAASSPPTSRPPVRTGRRKRRSTGPSASAR